MPETFRGRQVLSLPSWLREFLIVLAFFGFTSVMTWPWVTRLRDAVWDNGDSYAFAWSLWWNYHQTFHDPLNLFQANIFFPYRYTLAFTEHNFGISLLCFPLFALGLRPLTVLSIATFSGFALSGYGAFRLARTLTGSYGIAWTAGVLFAFVPFGFMLSLIPPFLVTVLEYGVGRGLLLFVLFFVVNFIGDNVIKPKIMGEGVGLSPLVIILGLLGWGAVLGPMGALLAIPLTITLKQVLPILLEEPSAPAARS